MIIARYNFKNQAILAPMAGVADTAFRLLCRRYGAAATVSELISSEGLVRASEKTHHMLAFLEDERPYAIQIFGHDAGHMAEAASIAAQAGPDWIDLNFGCPAKNVTKRGAGSAVMKDLDLMRDMVARTVKAVDIPVTAKIRSGWDAGSIVAVEAARIIEGEGAVAVTLHARTKKQAFSGEADWSLIKAVKEAVTIPVVGNGDIKSGEDGSRMLAETGCDAVMVGRGCYGRPWVFDHIHRVLAGDSGVTEPTPEERLDVCLEHYQLALDHLETDRAVKEMRKHIGWYVKGLRGASKLRQAVFHMADPEEVMDTLRTFQDRLSDTDMPETAPPGQA